MVDDWALAHKPPMQTPYPIMIQIQAGYRAFTSHVFTEAQAITYNAAVRRAINHPTEANLNGAHNLFNTIALTPRT